MVMMFQLVLLSDLTFADGLVHMSLQWRFVSMMLYWLMMLKDPTTPFMSSFLAPSFYGLLFG